MSSEVELKWLINPEGDRGTMDWNSDISTGAILLALTTNVTLASNNVEDNDLPLLLENPWVQLMEAQWDIWFEQREPCTHERQINQNQIQILSL